MNSKSLYAILGFGLFIIGFISIVLMLVGVQFSFLTWIDAPGRLFGFVSRIFMVIAGILIIVLSQTNWRNQEN